ncbi:MAG: hypothetical protein WCW13_02880 [archaeon]|jgi:hypothetical protein
MVIRYSGRKLCRNEKRTQQRIRISQTVGFKPALTPKQIVARMNYAQLKNRFTIYAHLPEDELRAIAEKELGKP